MNECIDCNYYTNNGCRLHLCKLHCKHNSLWTPKGYVRGLRAELSVLDDYAGIPQEIIEEICKPFVKERE